MQGPTGGRVSGTWNWMSEGLMGTGGREPDSVAPSPLCGALDRAGPLVGAPQEEAAPCPLSRCDHQFACQAQFPLRKPDPQPLEVEPWCPGQQAKWKDMSPEGSGCTGRAELALQSPIHPSSTEANPVPGLRQEPLTTPSPVLLREVWALLITSFTSKASLQLGAISLDSRSSAQKSEPPACMRARLL